MRGRLPTALIWALVLVFIEPTFAQEGQPAPASDAASVASAPGLAQNSGPTILPPLYALVNENVLGTDNSGDGCHYSAKFRSLPRDSMVVMVRRVLCQERYRTERRFIEILYEGKPYLVAEKDISTKPESLTALTSRATDDVNVSRPEWELASLRLTLGAKKQVFDKLSKSKAQGLAVVSAGIFDVSEHTEGTGFRIEVYNSGTKTIKYINVAIRGLNAVGDPVRAHLSRSSQAMFRGIGPIEPEKQASYEKQYMWMTDVVESFDIDSIKVDFMDGTSRTIPRKQLTWLTSREYQTLLGDAE